MPWVKRWSERIIESMKTANAHEYNLLLVAAHFFRDQDLFSQASLKILRGCTVHELNMIWNRSDELYSELPQAAKYRLTYGIGALQKRLDAAIHVVDVLKGLKSVYETSSFFPRRAR
ncbi:hypothetical protein SI65_04087 [Aspergillus cristatus]|uniref:Uncharacterized protein n=1 Tax=Aspergillus cristatus TaxID=573508 RepID=A0A1E3BJA6_ASPCR|nr:hypothetical protein SI65_04087 [Aspergillus cristatus]